MRSVLRCPTIRASLLMTVLGVGLPGVASAAPALQESFREAAQEFNVPADLLMGISYTTTAWHNAQGFDEHTAREFGVMGLRLQSEGPSLAEASAMVGLPVSEIQRSPEQNIRAGAALLAQYAVEAAGRAPVVGEIRLDNAEIWWEAASRYAGVSAPTHADMFAAHVFETLNQGAEGRADSGEMVRLAPSVLPSVLGDWISNARWAYNDQIQRSAPDVDYAGASWVPACSSNYTNSSRTAADISYIVIHKVEGSYSGCISWFQNCSASVSAHYVVSKYGDITQMVAEADIAWHAGNWDYNEMSVGIEHEGYTNSDDVTDAMYEASADLSRDICERNGIPKNRTYIIGHNEVPGATHTDPGPYWDWDLYMDLINCTAGGDCGGGGTDNVGNLVGYIREDDIYTGAGIPGATVALNSGESATTDSSGFYRFNDLVVGTYTVTASADCYLSNSVTKTLSEGIDNWASIPLTYTGNCGGDDGGPPSCSAPESIIHPVGGSQSSSGSVVLLGIGWVAFALQMRRRR